MPTVEPRPATTIRELRAAAEDSPADAAAGFALGCALIPRKNCREALRCLRAAVELAGDVAGHWSCLGTVLFHIGEWDEAVEPLQRALALDPESESEHVRGALASVYEARPETLGVARELFRRGLTRSPVWPESVRPRWRV